MSDCPFQPSKRSVNRDFTKPQAFVHRVFCLELPSVVDSVQRSVNSGHDGVSFYLRALRTALARRKLPFTEEAVIAIVDVLLSRRKLYQVDLAVTNLVTLVEKVAGKHGISDALRERLERLQPQLAENHGWLPDRTVTLYRDQYRWKAERSQTLGDTPAHRQFWRLLDRLAAVFWAASRRGIKVPLRTAEDVVRALRAVGPANLPLVRYLNWTMGDALRAHSLRENRPLVGLLAMLIEDTVHSTVDKAPLVQLLVRPPPEPRIWVGSPQLASIWLLFDRYVGTRPLSNGAAITPPPRPSLVLRPSGG